jgi:ATP-dependent Clp endopeptidase proteolytic subunit ClpP
MSNNESTDSYNSTVSTEKITFFESKSEIHFNGPIDHKSMSNLTNALLDMQANIIKKCKKLKRKFSEFEKGLDDDNDMIDIDFSPKPIKLYITSNGGYVYQVFGAIDTIESMDIPVHTVCKGMVASAGTLLSLSGKKRYITPNSYMLIHELRGGSWGKYQQLKDSFENSTKLMDHIKSIYLTKTKIQIDELDECLKKDVAWNAQTCLEKGLVDEISS